MVNFKITTHSVIHVIVQQFNMAQKAHMVRASKQSPVFSTHKDWFTIWCWYQHSVMSIGMMLKLTQVQLERYFTSVSDHPTNQIVQNLTLGIEFDWIKLLSSAIFTTFMTLTPPASYCEPASSRLCIILAPLNVSKSWLMWFMVLGLWSCCCNTALNWLCLLLYRQLDHTPGHKLRKSLLVLA